MSKTIGYKKVTKIKKVVEQQHVTTHLTHHGLTYHHIGPAHQHAATKSLQVEHTYGSPNPSDPPPSFEIPPNVSELVKNVQFMKTKWDRLPFAFPEETSKTDPTKLKINEILRFSMEQQKSEEISDNAGFVILIVRRCLNALGIDNRVAFGYRDNGKSEKDKVPHIWLVIQDHVIDNAYIKELSSKCTDYIQKHTPGCYHEVDRYEYPPCKAKHDPHLPVDTEQMSSVFMRKRIDIYARNPDRALAMNLNREQSYNYFFTMIRYMHEKYEVTVAGIDPILRHMCWWCGKFPKASRNYVNDDIIDIDRVTMVENNNKPKFSQCNKCMVANYCSVECQTEDWFENHKITCLSRGSVFLPPLGDIPFTSENI